MDRDPFKEYIRQSEPHKRDKGYAWHTAIGLQAVDGLKPSAYLVKTAIENIEGNITLNEAKEFISIHKKLFTGIYSHAGKIREYNITKKEWVLAGATVMYGSASELRATLEYDFSQEKNYSYKGLEMEDIIHHLAVFLSRLWQIHIFGEGNTRTTAVFFIKYLRTLGFDVTNDIFAENAWYFRNALVRANYNDLKKGIHETTEYLEKFLRNLILDEKNELYNRSIHVSGAFISYNKPDIANEKPDIGREKPDIEGFYYEYSPYYLEDDHNFSVIVQRQISNMYQAFGMEQIFGRSDVEKVLNLKYSRTSELLKQLLENRIIVPVKGYGKGKYLFWKGDSNADSRRKNSGKK